MTQKVVFLCWKVYVGSGIFCMYIHIINFKLSSINKSTDRWTDQQDDQQETIIPATIIWRGIKITKNSLRGVTYFVKGGNLRYNVPASFLKIIKIPN